MNKLIKRGLSIIGLLMATFNLVGFADDDSESFGWTFERTIDIGWEGALISIVVLAIIGLIVYLIVKKRGKK